MNERNVYQKMHNEEEGRRKEVKRFEDENARMGLTDEGTANKEDV